MSNLISAEKISKSFGIKHLLDGVSLGVQRGDRIGVVGLNGGGKTTLLEILAGIEPPDSGRVARLTDLRMAVVTQRGELPDGASVGDVVLGHLGVDEHEWAGDARIRNVLAGIGIDVLGLDTSVSDLSGGERRRVALAAALVRELDLLILDEPTNHLDIEGVQWLADHLVSRGSALIVVTHDRWFLDAVATQTWEVQNGTVDAYEGGYNDWIFARAERARLADAAEERRRNLARKELAWLRRGPPARTSKPRYRVEAAEKLIADVPEPRDSVALTAFAKRRLGRIVIELEDARLTTPDGRELAADLTWRLTPGERVGLVGINGSGKTTLLRALGGEIDVAPGRRTVQRVEMPAKAELRAILKFAPPRWAAFIRTALLTGMRASELRGLLWTDVDLKAGFVKVRRRVDLHNEFGPPKSAAGVRDIPIAPRLITDLKAWRLACPTGDLGLVFPNGAGRVESHSNLLNRVFHPMQIEAGVTLPSLPDEDGNPTVRAKYSLHALRHAAAALFIEQGLPPKRVQELMGHSSIQMTFDLYGYLFPAEDDDRKALRAIEKQLLG